MAAVAQPVLDPRLGAALAKPLADLDPLASATAESLETDGVSFAEQVRAFERRTLTRAYTLSGGNISRMARRLGMDRSSLYAKLRLYAIHTSRSG
jgi:transcriptional regulator of acetoin/glycerol metabolism